MRQWLGSSVSVLLGVGLSLWSVRHDMPGWVVAATVVLALVGVVLCWPVRAAPLEPERVTFRGDVQASTMIGVYSEADSFVQGDVRESLLMHVLHRPKTRP